MKEKDGSGHAWLVYVLYFLRSSFTIFFCLFDKELFMSNLTRTSITSAFQCKYATEKKINPSEPSISSMVSSLQVDKKMKQPQNKQMKNSLPSNQGSDLQVQRLRAKLPYVY